MSSAASATPLEPQPLSEVERVVDTFVAPGKTFTDLRRSANWLVPWLLIAIASIALSAVVDKKVGMRTAFENQMALQPKRQAQLDQLPPDRREAQIQAAGTVTRIFAYSSPVLILIFFAIGAAVFMGTFNFGFGSELTFNRSLAVLMYAWLPSILQVLIAISAILIGGGQAFTFDNPVASNLSGLVDYHSHFLYSIAISLDLFTIWALLLEGIGFSCLTKLKRGTCMGVVFGWWAVWVLVKAGMAAAFS